VPTTSSAVRTEALYIAEIAALCGVAIAQPVLDVMGRSPDVFLFRDASSTDIVAFALLFTVVPIAVVAGAAALTRLLGERARTSVQVGIVAVGFGVIGLQVTNRIADGLPTIVKTLVAVFIAVAMALAYRRFEPVRTWLRFAAVAPLLFLALFLLASPTADLLRGSDVAAADVKTDGALPPLVMLVVDEFPTASLMDTNGNVDARLFPNFARLAATSTWYRDYTTVSNQTWHAVPSMVEGRFPREVPPIARSHPRTLFTLLGGVYDIHAAETITRLCPESVCESTPGTSGGGVRKLAADGRRIWLDVTSPTDRESQASAEFVEEAAGRAEGVARATKEGDAADAQDFEVNSPARFEDFLATLGTRPGRRPFDYFHMLLPHEAWRYYPSGRSYAIPKEGVGRVGKNDTWVDDPRATELGRQRHLLQAIYVDRLLGRLLDRMEKVDVLNRTALVVVADHGIGFRPGLPARALEKGDVNPAILPELAWAPLFVKEPGQVKGRVDDRSVQLIDVMPTIVDLVGVDLPWKVDGISAYRGGPRPDKTFVKSTSTPFGPTVGPREVIDAGTLRPRVREYAAGNFVADDGDDPVLDVYRAGRFGALVGTRVHDAQVAGDAGTQAIVDDAGRFDDVDVKGGGELPGLVTGALRARDDRPVVIALNGRIAGVSALFEDRGRGNSFAAIVPETFFRDGANDLECYLLDGTATAPVLHPLARG
jgi:hypothetical protein